MSRLSLPSVLAGVVISLGTLSLSAYLTGVRPTFIPLDLNIQPDYIKPSQLEIRLNDLDGDGGNETIIRIKGKNYLLKYDLNGKPAIVEYEIVEYEIKPAEIIQK